MGKIYEALNKAERERNLQGWAVAAATPQTERDRKYDPGTTDFMEYSLNAPATVGIDRMQREESASARGRGQSEYPLREVSLDPAAIHPQLVAFYAQGTKASDEYNKLAANLISVASERKLKRLLIASAQHGEGRTCVALNLACALARAKQRVLVLDADLQRPSLHSLLAVSAELGLSEALADNKPAASAMVRVLPYGFDLLPTRERVENSAELLVSDSFRDTLQSLDPDYDFILFDSSPILAAADSSLLVRLMDATLLVIRAGKTNSDQIGKALAPFTQQNILGVVLNRADS